MYVAGARPQEGLALDAWTSAVRPSKPQGKFRLKSHYTQNFRGKWSNPQFASSEIFLESSDIESLSAVITSVTSIGKLQAPRHSLFPEQLPHGHTCVPKLNRLTAGSRPGT